MTEVFSQAVSFYFSELLFWSHTLKSTFEGSDRKCSSVTEQSSMRKYKSVIIISMTSPVLVLFLLLLLLSAFLVLAAGLAGAGFFFLGCKHQTNIRSTTTQDMREPNVTKPSRREDSAAAENKKDSSV